MPAGVIKIVWNKADGTEYARYIACSNLPNEGGVGELKISGVSRLTEPDKPGKPGYPYLLIPSDENPINADPGMTLEIRLGDTLAEDRMILPQNGGTPGVSISVKHTII
jgi:hypothetical protein